MEPHPAVPAPFDKPISIDGDEEVTHRAEGRPPAIRAGAGEPCPLPAAQMRGRAPSLVGAPAREALGPWSPGVPIAQPRSRGTA